MPLPEPPAYDVYELERRAREFLRHHLGPDVSIPIDIELLLEKLEGVDLDHWPGLRANHGIEGMVARDPKTGELVVLIDDRIADTKPTRYRMTVAEELGHLVLHRELIDRVHSPSDFKELQQHYRWYEMERNAKRFAAAILMPGDLLASHTERLYPQLVAVAGFGNAPAVLRQLAVTLAKRFEVSTQAMQYRLEEWPMRLKQRVEDAMRNRLDFLG